MQLNISPYKQTVELWAFLHSGPKNLINATPQNPYNINSPIV